MSSTVKINLAQAGVVLQPNQTYTIKIDEGFVKESGTFQQVSPLITTFVSFTTDSGPSLSSTVPSNNSTNVLNISQLQLIFDRSIFANTGNFYLYKNGSPDVLISTISVSNTSKVTFVDEECFINISGLLSADETFYLLSDADVVKDFAGVPYAGLLNENQLRFITANLEFPDLRSNMNSAFSVSASSFIDPAIRASISSAANLTFGNNVFVVPFDLRYLGTVSNMVYVEDTAMNIANYPQITDTIYQNEGGGGEYTYTITPNNTNAIKLISETGSGADTTFNATTKVFTIEGTKTQVNNCLANLILTPNTDFDSSFVLTYAVTTPQSNTASKLQNVTLTSPFDTEITFLFPASNRTFNRNEGAELFDQFGTYISDFDLEPTNQYTITLETSSGGFASIGELTDLTEGTWTYTGTKSQVNTKLGFIEFYPQNNLATNATFTVKFAKNSVEFSNNTINLIYSGVGTSYSQTYTYTSSGTWAPTALEKRYGSVAVTIQGGGGGGATTKGGGGGASGLIATTTLTAPLNNSYSFTIGQGGARGTGGNSNGSPGGTTTFSGTSATGGGGGISGIGGLNANGGDNDNFNGGLGFTDGDKAGGGGAGPGQNGNNATLNAGTYFGGTGGGAFGGAGTVRGGYGGGDTYNAPLTTNGSGGNGGLIDSGGSSGISGSVRLVVTYS
jgi:hypothetical protein